MTFREPKTWRGRVTTTDLNREVRDQLRALRSAVTTLEAGTPSTGVLPLGYVMGWAGSTIPVGWLVCDGQQVSKSTYPDLYDALLTTYGADTAMTFAVPDFSGNFLRGANSAGDGTLGTRGTSGGYANANLDLALSGGTFNVSVTSNSDGNHSHGFNTQHSHTANHNSNAWSVNDSHGHNFNDHSHGGATTGSGGTTAGAGNLGTCVAHAHNMSGSNSTGWGGGHGHSGDIGNSVQFTSSTVGYDANTATTNNTGAHSHAANHTHNPDHAHATITDRLPEYDEINWLINWQADPEENWFIAGEAILGTSMIGA
jgi:microcystin-dependent protein